MPGPASLFMICFASRQARSASRSAHRSLNSLLVAVSMVLFAAPPLAAQEIRLRPRSLLLVGPESYAQTIVEAPHDTGPVADLTARASFQIMDPSIAVVSAAGLVEAVGDGTTQLTAEIDGQTVTAEVHVQHVADPSPLSFHHDVNPVLTKAGCNSGACHGKAEGKNGFRLSLFGFDVPADHAALTQQSRGRRVNVASPEASLLLRKGSGAIPHGGGQALAADSFGYRRLRRWIEEGARLERELAAPIDHVEVYPATRTIRAANASADPRSRTQQLRVIARDAAGHQRDVTAEAAYETNAPTIAEVDAGGQVRFSGVPGEAALLVRYLGHIAVSRLQVPGPPIDFVRPPQNNFVDALVWDKLEVMGIQPSEPCDDATFLRRLFLDLIGTLPTAAEARSFLDSRQPNKRSLLVDRLLDRPEYAQYWSLLWSDLMRVDANALGAKRSVAMTRWLRSQFAHNRPFDEMARDIVTARGDMRRLAPTALYASFRKPEETASAISQLLLGVRIECAQCHHHPFERWSQRDFYALAGFFTGTKQKTLPSGGTSLVLTAGRDLRHPRTGTTIRAAGLGESDPAAEPPAEAVAVEAVARFVGQRDRRTRLADWMTDADNPFFARAIANRLWAHYFGRGLVEPVDDLRASNPATNEPLLDALAAHLCDTDYDLKAFTRTLVQSRVYQLSGETNATNRADEQNFSHAETRTLPAEVLLDAICQVTGSPEKFNGWPVGSRAIEVWDNRMPSYFFRIFGRPQRTTVCACERGDSPSITQALHLMNSPELHAKLNAREGNTRRWASSPADAETVLERIYLTALARRPRPSESSLMLDLLNDPAVPRQTAIEDILWTLMNSKEFLYNH